MVGYSGKIYHAWISTYITDVGWVNGIIYFDGANWKRMDPTFASSEQQSDRIMKYIENSSNYNPMTIRFSQQSGSGLLNAKIDYLSLDQPDTPVYTLDTTFYRP